MQSDKSIAVLSPNDAEILIRLHDDLLPYGFIDDKKWNDKCSPLDNTYLEYAKEEGRSFWNYTLFVSGICGLSYHPHDCIADIHINLTPANYNETLETILSHFNIPVIHGKGEE